MPRNIGEPKNICACGCGEKCHRTYVYNHHLNKKKPKVKDKLCQCGCGKLCYNKYVHGHHSKGRKLSEEGKAKISKANTGRKHSQETRDKIKQAVKGRKLSKEHKEKLSKAFSGEKNPFYGKKHTKESLEKMSKSHKGYPAWNKGKKLSKPAWNKGIPCSQETKEKLRNINLGKKLSEDTKEKIRISSTGRKHTQKVKDKLREIQSGRGNWIYGKTHSEETKRKMGNSRLGEKNPSWKGGVSFEEYPIEFNIHLKTIVRERDEFCCRLCGRHESEFEIKHAVHHIDYDKKNSSVKNLVSLCNSCHSKTNGNRKYWESYFQNNTNNPQNRHAVKHLNKNNTKVP